MEVSNSVLEISAVERFLYKPSVHRSAESSHLLGAHLFTPCDPYGRITYGRCGDLAQAPLPCSGAKSNGSVSF